MQDDIRLLERYAREHAEEAFAQLVQRHVNLVYSAALRQTGGDALTAEDITQRVFTELARQAGRLTRHPALAGWLYTTTRNLALQAMRNEQRRQRREQAAEMTRETVTNTEAAPDWNHLAPVLDEAMHELSEKDRQAILLRYFEGADFRAVGASLGLSDGAARMRVERALDKLRDGLSRRGVTSTASTLAAALATHAVLTAPATVLASVAPSALAAAAVATPVTWGILKVMAMTKTKTAVLAGLTAALAAGVYVQTQSLNRARVEVAELRAASVRPVAEVARNSPAKPGLAPLTEAERRELLQLRGEVGGLRRQLAAAPPANDKATPAPDPDRGDYSGETWPLAGIRPAGNKTALAAVQTAIAAVLAGDFASFYALRSTNSAFWSADESKARAMFARLVANHKDVKGFRVSRFSVPHSGPSLCQYSLERTQPALPEEDTMYDVTVRPEVNAWKLDRFAVSYFFFR